PIHCVSSVESSFEYGVLRARNRNITTGPPQPHDELEIWVDDPLAWTEKIFRWVVALPFGTLFFSFCRSMPQTRNRECQLNGSTQKDLLKI
ncbi:hypothetical protein AVEN_113825-1, partial [Araneus ventricosus]